MLFKVLLLVLPILCDAKICINVTVSSNIDFIDIKYSGHDNKIVTDQEIEIFNISTANLNRGFRVELGKVPDRILLKDPTPYGNLFHKFKWPEVKRHIEVDRIEVTDVLNEPVVLESTYVSNNANGTIDTSRSVYIDVENDVYSTWSYEGLPKANVTLNMTLKFDHSSFNYLYKWRDHTLKSKVVKFGITTNGNITLKENQTIVKTLSANRTIIGLKIVYKATMIGNVIGDYENLYGKYHFWAPTINDIMRAANITNEIRTSERLEIRCFTDPTLEVYDKDTGVIIRKKRRLVFKMKPKKTVVKKHEIW